MGNICTICSWKCKQDVKECPFFNEDKNIPVLGMVTGEGFFLTPREAMSHLGNARREAMIEDVRRLAGEGSISVPRNISIEIRDAQEPLNTSHSDNDLEVHDHE